MDQYVERVVDLTDPAVNHLYNLDLDAARDRVLSADGEAVRGIEGSFAIVARTKG
jgi:asparagine synthase (glutamine-hydrolysing)